MYSSTGIRYKKHMIYMDCTYDEAQSSIIERLWFVVRNLCREKYEELVILSKYYYNVKYYKMKYEDDIHEELNKLT